MQQKPDDFISQDLTVYGEALSDFGLAQINAIAGIGLVTRGLVWPCPQIWFVGATTVSSTWNASASASLTTWNQSAGAGSSTITTWSKEPKAGPWAEC